MPKNQSPVPCAIERWNLSDVSAVKTTPDEKHLNALLESVADAMHRAVNETMSKLLAPHRDLVPLLHALRGVHMQLANEIGLVEEWMSVLMKQEGVPLEYIGTERAKGMSDGQRHAKAHFVDGCEKCTN